MGPEIGSKDRAIVQGIELPGGLHDRLINCKTLPSIPAVVMKVVDMCGDDNVSLGQIAKVLSKDPTLAATVMKVANSAYYWVASEVRTLDRAVCTLGINATLSLALSYSFVRIMRSKDRQGFDYAYYWQRSVITAVAARTMVKWSHQVHREELFLAGLLQDIGMLALSEAMTEEYGKLILLAKRDHSRLIEIENERLGTDHSKVGAWLLGNWNLPEDIQLSLAFSHEPKLNCKQDIQHYINVTALAGLITEIWTNPATVEATGLANDSASEILDMSSECFNQAIGDIANAIPEVTSYLNIDIGGEKRIGELLDRAREALINLNLQAQQQMLQMQDLALHDGLTNLYNRSFLERALPQYMDVAKKMRQPLSVIFVDLDHFKRINDLYGHQTGDAILTSVANILKSVMRTSDLVARYGGEEFVCILPNADEHVACMVGDRLRDAIASQAMTTDTGISLEVTASFGCATLSVDFPYENHTTLLEQADRCLYAAKRAGRNRVMVAGRLQLENIACAESA
jgi:diguanylate cyclase (GGDEF)-like protein